MLGLPFPPKLVASRSPIGAIDIVLFRPVQPMLAEPASDVEDALARLGRAAFEVKLDGFRVQVHKDSDQIRAYSRALNDVTREVGPLLDVVRALPAPFACFARAAIVCGLPRLLHSYAREGTAAVHPGAAARPRGGSSRTP